ncbi:serine protease [Pseudonocardia sp. N23]|uniref:S1 family peptidase n=1 Tax=Pseudonocardia sp. N23 TaxID=1987376 RepID=UPI000BFB639F|nr:serine protease [Pseudonocardia sp. N23]GAY08628.1 peptidase S1 and S6, chymotrypsin/Hap [Pseudonocardia sp. N23]
MALRTLSRVATVGAAAVAAALIGVAPAVAQTSAPPGSPQAATATEKTAAAVRPAITYLTSTFTGYVADESGTFFNNGAPYQLSTTCTGFGVNPNGYVATAGHCVDTSTANGIKSEFVLAAAQQVVAAIPGVDLATAYQYGMANWTVEGATKGSPIDAQISVINGSNTNANALPARVVDYRPLDQGDVALLKVETTDLPSVELATDADVQIGTPVLSIGYPASADAVTDASLEPSNKDGQVSSKKTLGTVPVYETSAALSGGMSGGPTVGLDGRVIGVNSFKPASESQAFNFIAPSQGLSELLSRNGVRNELGPEDKNFRAALDAYYGGHYTDAIAGFDKLLQVHPQHAQATQFKTLAAKARDKFGDTPVAPPASEGMPPILMWSLIGGGAVLLIAGATTILLVSRKRRPGGPAPAGNGYPVQPNPNAPQNVPHNMAPSDGYAAQNGYGRQLGYAPQGYAAPQGYQAPQGYTAQPGHQAPQGYTAQPGHPAPQGQPVRQAGPVAPTSPPVGIPAVGPQQTWQQDGALYRPAPPVAPADSSFDPGATTVVVDHPAPVGCITCGTTLAPDAAACTTCGRPRG